MGPAWSKERERMILAMEKVEATDAVSDAPRVMLRRLVLVDDRLQDAAVPATTQLGLVEKYI